MLIGNVIGISWYKIIGGVDPSIVAYDLADDVKLWALITTGKISGSKQTIVGIQASFEV